MTNEDEPEAVGLHALLGGGLSEAMAAADAMMGDVQRALRQTMDGLSVVQSVGVAVTSVPPTENDAGPDWPEPIAAPAHAVTEPSASALAGVAPGAPLQAVASAAPVALAAPLAAATTQPPPVAVAAMPVAPVTFASFAPVADGLSAPTGVDGADAANMPTAPAPAEHHVSVRRQRAFVAASQGGANEEPEASVAGMRSMAPAAQQAGSAGPTGGDVFLDGTLMGTWIADHLAREVGRPQVGGTGFDPRLTPAWPGTMQGG